jgi:hypothetical protein
MLMKFCLHHISDTSASNSASTQSSSNNGSSSALVPYRLAVRDNTTADSVLHTLVVEVQPADSETAGSDTGKHNCYYHHCYMLLGSLRTLQSLNQSHISLPITRPMIAASVTCAVDT